MPDVTTSATTGQRAEWITTPVTYVQQEPAPVAYTVTPHQPTSR